MSEGAEIGEIERAPFWRLRVHVRQVVEVGRQGRLAVHRNRPRRGFAHLRAEAAVDRRDRQMPEEIDDEWSGEPLEELSEAWSDAGERGRRGIERKQYLGTQALQSSGRAIAASGAAASMPKIPRR